MVRAHQEAPIAFLAQSGEHLLDVQKVVGSIPSKRTKKKNFSGLSPLFILYLLYKEKGEKIMESSGSMERVRIEQLIDFKKVNFQIKDIYSSLPLVRNTALSFARRIDFTKEDFYYNIETNLYEKTFTYKDPITGKNSYIKTYAKEEDFTEGPIRTINEKDSRKPLDELSYDTQKCIEVIIFFILAVFLIVVSIVGIVICCNYH